MQFANVSAFIVSNVLGSVISSNVSLLKYFEVTSVIPSPNVTFVKLSQPLKTSSPILCIVPGILIVLIDVPKNAPLPIVFIPSLSSTFSNFLQFANVFASIVSNVLGSIISSNVSLLK